MNSSWCAWTYFYFIASFFLTSIQVHCLKPTTSCSGQNVLPEHHFVRNKFLCKILSNPDTLEKFVTWLFSFSSDQFVLSYIGACPIGSCYLTSKKKRLESHIKKTPQAYHCSDQLAPKASSFYCTFATSFVGELLWCLFHFAPLSR
jgi:hypothetical protein